MTGLPPREHVEEFRRLHDAPEILKLPCAWDAASARLFEEIGFPAIGTSSGAIAHSWGYQDGEHIPVEAAIGTVDRITDAVSIPVSADVEAGYGSTVDEVVRTVEAVIEAGAVGINVEDGTGERASPLVPVDEQERLIEALRDLGESIGRPFVVNARTDAVLQGGQDSREAVDEAIERANAYRDAGADCLFPIGVTDPPVVERVVEAVDGPVNVLAFGTDGPTPAELQRLGVDRVSNGAGPFHASMAPVRRVGREMLDSGGYPPVADERVTRWEFEEWFGAGSG